MPFLLPQLRTRITISLITVLAASAARADRRDFVRAYQYATQPQGNLEVEIWNDVDAPSAGGFDQAVVTPRFELEYGLTDHWDVALYHVFEQPPASPLHFDSWRLETRYRLAEKGVWPVDVMLYLEGERPAQFAEPWELEEKVILARDFGSSFTPTKAICGRSTPARATRSRPRCTSPANSGPRRRR